MLRHLALVALLGCGQAQAPTEPSTARAEVTGAIDAFVSAGRTPAAYRELSTGLIALRDRAPAVSDEVERRLVALALVPTIQIADTSPNAQVERLALTVWPTLLAPAGTPIDSDVWPRATEDGWTYLERLCREDQVVGCAAVVPEFRAHVVAATVADRAYSRMKYAIAACDECADDQGWHEVRRGWEGVARSAAATLAGVDHRGRVEAWPIAGVGAQREDRAPAFEIEIGAAGELLFDGYSYDSTFRRPILRDAKQRGTVAFYMQPAAPLRQLAELLRDAHAAGFPTITLLAREPSYPFARRAYTLATSRASFTGMDRPIQLFLRTVDTDAATEMAVRACRERARAGLADHSPSRPDFRTGSRASC
jgi:hypothetical protein